MTLEDNMATAVDGLVNGNVYAGFLPRGLTDDVTKLPAVSYFIVAPSVEHNQQNYLRTPRYRFDVWGTDLDQILTAAGQIINALDHKQGLGFSALFQGEIDVDDPDSRLFHRVLEFLVWGN
jgi:hypothetical protein